MSPLKKLLYYLISKLRKLMFELYARYKFVKGLSKRKVFCIGFNKTGTSSLHFFFEKIGLSSTHNTSWPKYSKARKIDKKLFVHQCYSDGEQSDFVALDSVFPKSLFIMNDRNERDWLYSRLKHVMRHNEKKNKLNILSNKKYGPMARDFFFNEKLTITKWICEHRIYIMQVIHYFRDRDDFIEIDVTKSKQWEIQLLEFFKKNSFHVKQFEVENNKLHYNRRDSDCISDQVLLKKYKQLIDKILTEMDSYDFSKH